MPLFDHLTVRPPQLPRGDAAGRRFLLESIRLELERLLNSRVPEPAHELRERPRTVIDYGIPDFSHLTPNPKAARDWVAPEIAAAVEAFEPRLTQIRVVVDLDKDRPDAMSLRVEAHLVGEEESAPISFPVMLRAEPGESEVHAAS